MKWLFWLLVPFTCFGAGEIEIARDKKAEVGILFQILLPNILQGFPRSLGVYGPYVGVPVGDLAIQAQGFYGKSEEQSAWLGELALRHNLRTPFFTAHLLAGPHVLKTTFVNEEHTRVGGHLGFGFDVPFSKTFEVGVLTKLYLQERAILSFGGGFGIFL